MAEPYLEMLSQMITSLNLPNSDEVLLECKHFFSGAALYANGKICASLTPAGFGLKLPANFRQRLIEAGDATELRYFDKAPVKKEYVVLSQSIVEDLDEMKSLVILSIRYVVEGEGTD
jgi:TfoX/Sxy family transcriptional regulator of competence genes